MPVLAWRYAVLAKLAAREQRDAAREDRRAARLSAVNHETFDHPPEFTTQSLTEKAT